MQGIGKALKLIRKDLNLRRKEFAELLGCSVAYLDQIESGFREPSEIFNRLIICSLFVDPKFLKIAKGDIYIKPREVIRKLQKAKYPYLADLFLPVDANEFAGLDAEEKELCKKFKKLIREDKDMIKKMVDKILASYLRAAQEKEGTEVLETPRAKTA